MPMMKKEELEAQARRLGIEFPEGMRYASKNKLVIEAMKREQLDAPDKDAEIARLKAEVAQLRQQANDAEHKKLQPEAEPKESEIPKGRVILAPEMKPTKYQLLKYEEELGQEVYVENVSWRDDRGGIREFEKDTQTGTFRIKGKSGRRVVAQSTAPKENAGVSYNPETDLVPVVSWRGKRGYIWTHQHYPNIKELLMTCGKYHDYEELFDSQVHPDNIWYAAGKMLVCSISTVHKIFDEIEREAKR